ncbi:MAG TPA: lysylphosphatidylglycerol synthase transmembrane domain-containing protein [Nitrolancea sp.]|nr:lysylphosphatidylglycerol synthase transmembrane domain-containing protein [Nitrolancea sp.]
MMSDPESSLEPESDAPREPRLGIESFIRRRFLLGVGFGILITAAFIVLSVGSEVLQSLKTFAWRLVPLILALSLSNYLLRFIKWHLYLHWVESGAMSKLTSLLIFMSGLSMAITPGKVGEFLKPYLVRRVNGAAISVTAPIVVAERLTDGIAILVLAALGLLQIRHGWMLLVALGILFVTFTLLIQRRSLIESILRRFEHIALIGKRAETLERLYESTWKMFRPQKLAIAVAISVVSWAGECVAFYLIMLGLGFPASAHLLFAAASSLAIATMIGALSLLPGGLGAAELSATGLLILFVGSAHIDHETAATATLLVRFATFWFGIALGLIALLSSDWYLNRINNAASQR